MILRLMTTVKVPDFSQAEFVCQEILYEVSAFLILLLLIDKRMEFDMIGIKWVIGFI